MDTLTSVLHARSRLLALSLQRFLMKTDVVAAWAKSWREMLIRDELKELRQSQRQT